MKDDMYIACSSEKEILQKYGLTVEQLVENFKIYNTYAEVIK